MKQKTNMKEELKQAIEDSSVVTEITDELIDELKALSIEDRLTKLLYLLDTIDNNKDIRVEWKPIRKHFTVELRALLKANSDEDENLTANHKSTEEEKEADRAIVVKAAMKRML